MEELTWLLMGIALLFFVLLLLKELLPEKTKKNFCVICRAVCLGWLVGLSLYFLGIFKEVLLLAVLMGQSSIGAYYLLDKKKWFKLFRLPFILTALVVIYFLLKKDWLMESLVFLLAVWLLFGFIYLFKSNRYLNSLAKKILACCREA